MDITIVILTYLANGFGIWCFAIQTEPTTKSLGGMVGYTLLWPLLLVVCIFMAIMEAW